MNDPYLLFRNIKKARELSGLSQKELSKKLGISSKTISAYETGRAIPPLPILIKISEVTGTDLKEIVTSETKSSKKSEINAKIQELEERVSNLEQTIVKLIK